MGYYIEHAPNGGYTPSFFLIEINSETDCKNLLKDDYLPTVVHEYIHFLQDFYTIYGMTRTITTYDLISYLYNSDKKEITLPIDVNSFFPENHCASINNQLFAIYENPINETEYGIRINRNEFNRVEIDRDLRIVSGKEVCSFTIKLINNDETRYVFPFGAQAIIECMASLFERLLFPNENRSFLIPYDLPRIVAETYYGTISPKKLFVICAASLMGYNASELFLMILGNEEIFLNLNNIYSIGCHIHLQELQKHSFQDLFYSTRNRLIDAITNIFNVDNEVFNQARDWAINWLQYCNSYYFFDEIAELFDLSPTRARHAFFSFLRRRVSPIIVNKKGELCVIGSEHIDSNKAPNISFWINIMNMFKYVFIEEDSCCCNATVCNEQNVLDDNCIVCPLAGRIKKQPYCIFRQLFQMWGLNRRTVIKGSDSIGPLNEN